MTLTTHTLVGSIFLTGDGDWIPRLCHGADGHRTYWWETILGLVQHYAQDLVRDEIVTALVEKSGHNPIKFSIYINRPRKTSISTFNFRRGNFFQIRELWSLLGLSGKNGRGLSFFFLFKNFKCSTINFSESYFDSENKVLLHAAGILVSSCIASPLSHPRLLLLLWFPCCIIPMNRRKVPH